MNNKFSLKRIRSLDTSTGTAIPDNVDNTSNNGLCNVNGTSPAFTGTTGIANFSAILYPIEVMPSAGIDCPPVATINCSVSIQPCEVYNLNPLSKDSTSSNCVCSINLTCPF